MAFMFLSYIFMCAFVDMVFFWSKTNGVAAEAAVVVVR